MQETTRITISITRTTTMRMEEKQTSKTSTTLPKVRLGLLNGPVLANSYTGLKGDDPDAAIKAFEAIITKEDGQGEW